MADDDKKPEEMAGEGNGALAAGGVTDGGPDPLEADPMAPDPMAPDPMDWPARLWYEFRVAVGYLTRIPVFSLEYAGLASLGQAAWAFAAIGLLIGLAGAILIWIFAAVGLPPFVTAIVTLAVIMMVTGARHETGWAAAAEGFARKGDAAEKRAAAEAGQTGPHAVLALILSVGIRWAILADLAAAGSGLAAVAILAAAAASRGVLPVMHHYMADADPKREADAFDGPGSGPVWISVLISLVLLLIIAGFGTTIALAVVTIVLLIALGLIANRQFGGRTEPVVDTGQQLLEIIVLLAALGLVE